MCVCVFVCVCVSDASFWSLISNQHQRTDDDTEGDVLRSTGTPGFDPLTGLNIRPGELADDDDMMAVVVVVVAVVKMWLI